jgi:4-alpha-glucanotransferase
MHVRIAEAQGYGADMTDKALTELARAHGVATWYDDWQGRRVRVDLDVIRAVLAVLEVDTRKPRRRSPTVVVRQGQKPPRVPDGVLRAEDGGVRDVRDRLPADLSPGWYRLTHGPEQTTVIVTPPKLAVPPRTWGWMLQLYALRSQASWGAGDFGDLATFAAHAAGTGAGALLLNPLHAVAPVRPVPASPYSPSSRRYVNPLYLRVEHTSAYRKADAATRSTVDGMRPPNDTDLIDYDAVWDAKQRALELLWTTTAKHKPSTDGFATYCALAEEYGADWRTWPQELRRPGNPAIAKAPADRVAFHAWLQRLCDEQLGAAAKAAKGMPVGIVHDLAVGIDPGGADGWMLQDVLADGVRVGAPPDAFNQLGQDWGLAAWRPDRLAATGYQAYRDLLAATFRHGGGLRVDHVAGLWRLWWIPPGASADQGTYVHYDADAMLGALLTEAHRAGAVVVGEDLGTVLPVVRETMRKRTVLGSSVLWFTRDYADPKAPFIPPRKWPRLSLASISTHDLPTVPGFLSGDHVRVRAELGILARPVDVEVAVAEADREALMDLLKAEGLTGDDPVFALHELLARTRCRLVMASPYDVLGEVRQPNLPGTSGEYPNWRIPLPKPLEDVVTDERMARVAKILRRRARRS